MSVDAILHLATLHALSQAGFASTSRSASLSLSSVLSRYLAVVGRSCAERAALAGRSKVAAIDVIEALEDLGVGGVDELQDWTAGRDEEVFVGGKMDELAQCLRDGLSVDEGIRLHYVPRDDNDMDVDSEEEEGEDEPDDAMPDVKHDVSFRSQTPPLAWLPLPSGSSSGPSRARGVVASDIEADLDAPATLADRYRKPVPYASSQLAQERPFDPPKVPAPTSLPPAPSSFPSLLAAYKATASEISVTPRQNEVRRQAAEIARSIAAHPEAFSPPDTLSTPLTPPHATPIVPSHTETASYQAHMVPANPRRGGMLSTLVHSIRSPHLPPVLRERLTALRPPAPHKAAPTFGEPVRGPSDAALARARGKPADAEQELYLRATWDSGPHGLERAKGKLPTGRKVVASGEGEMKPRGLEVRKAEPLKLKIRRESEAGTPGTPAGDSAAGTLSTGLVLDAPVKLEPEQTESPMALD
ncbi:hypothetical protein Q5752_002612 [Cryptotrichosporon argae]